MEEAPMDIDDVDMKEIEENRTTQRKYWTLESKVKVLDYTKENKVNPCKASRVFENKYSVKSYINGKWMKIQSEKLQ